MSFLLKKRGTSINGINPIGHNLYFSFYENTTEGQYRLGGEITILTNGVDRWERGDIPKDIEQEIIRFKRVNEDADAQEIANWLQNQKGVYIREEDIRRILRRYNLGNEDMLTLPPNRLNSKINPLSQKEECETCENRRYQDASDDSTVSFKFPTKLSRTQAEVEVRSHEHEHILRERAKAARDEKEVVHASIRIKYAICSECKERYVAGGEAVIKTRPKGVEKPQIEGLISLPSNHQEKPKEKRQSISGILLDEVA